MDSAELSRATSIHKWRDLWKLHHTRQLDEFLAKVDNLSARSTGLDDDDEKDEEALTYLLFELSKYPTSYPTNKSNEFIRAKSALATLKNANWFIPPYEVEFDKFNAFNRGAFGKVYHGKWKRSQVVVKKVKLRNEEDQASFLNEVEIWHRLYHPHVVQLFGACHIGKPFFVCEYASRGQLDNYLRDHPGELWGKLYEAALGLRYLHVKRVVHGDLKCNNILVGTDGYAKLTDFGLSRLKSIKTGCKKVRVETTCKKKLCVRAIRWKAPEVLRGEKSTFASDIYSFGMCILEVVSGKYPWGMTLDPVVKHFVLKQRRIPQRPPQCTEEAYKFVQQMCQFDPNERIGINEVICTLKSLLTPIP